MQKNSAIDFRKWCDENLDIKNLEKTEGVLMEALKLVGCKAKSIYDITDCNELRKYISELVVKRHAIKIENSREYANSVMWLIGYVEWLESAYTKNSEDLGIEDRLKTRDKTIDSLTIAYYLSRVDKEALKELGYKNYTEAFKKLADILKQKPATIKNMRDEFDPYFDNGRKGWYQRELVGTRKEVFDKYASVSDRKLTEVVKEILSIYAGEMKNEVKPPHTRLKIGSNNMKEIRSKR